MEETTKEEGDNNVRVAVRCRPFNTKERNNNETSCVRFYEDKLILVNPNGTGEEHSFAFDLIFDQNSRQDMLWSKIGNPILSKAFSGYNGTIFAYGQTGSGKTWSMQGAEGNEGIIPRMNGALFDRISMEKATRTTVLFLVTVSYFEIYNEVIFDLLDPSDRKKHRGGGGGGGGGNKGGGLEIKEHPVLGVYVKGLQEIVVDSAVKLQSIIDEGMGNRTVASTAMNADSSRSHSVFQITLHQKDVEDETKNVFAKVNLVDLAGSERVKSTGASGATLKEGANINKSLSELGNVINALVEQAKGKRAFIPYRNSKLTRVLQESLGGNSITAMLAALSPAACNFEETLSTLKYANRAKAIKVNAVKNEEASQISKLNDEIRMLKEKLMGQNPTASVDTTEIEERHRQQLKDLEDAMKSTWEDKAKASETHEEERRKLEQEQRKAARQLEVAKERHWKMLEEKSDLDLSLMHLKDISRKTPEVLSVLSTWQGLLLELTRLEQRVGEQFTVVQVYKVALEKDCDVLLKAPKLTATTSFDKSTVSQWKQFKDKIVGTRTEVQRWTDMQDALQTAVANLLREVASKFSNFQGKFKALLSQSSKSHPNNPNISASAAAAAVGGDDGVSGGAEDGIAAGAVGRISNQDMVEVMRGMKLIRSQVKEKFKRMQIEISNTRSNVLQLDTIGQQFSEHLERYQGIITECATIMDDVPEKEKEKKDILKCLKECSSSFRVLLSRSAESKGLISTSASTASLLQSSSTNALASGTGLKSSTSSSSSSNGVVAEVSPSLYDIECSTHSHIISSSTTAHKDIRHEDCKSGLITTHGDCCWSTTQSMKGSSGSGGGEYVELSVQSGIKVTQLLIQGGVVPVDCIHSGTSSSSGSSSTTHNAKSTSVIPHHPASLTPETVSLPCGISLSSCSGEVEDTTRAMADVIDWSVMLKKNPPDKFLKRPPVRFIFDLIKFLGEALPGWLPADVVSADWEAVSSNKQAKSEYMETVPKPKDTPPILSFASNALHRSSATTSSAAIISGSDAHLTNQLLQELAILAYCFKQNAIVTAGDKALVSSVSDSYIAAASHTTAASKPTRVNVSSWPTNIRISVSSDGDVWSTQSSSQQGISTHLANETDIFEYALDYSTFLPAIEDEMAVRFVRVYILASHQSPADTPANASNTHTNTGSDANHHIIPSVSSLRISVRGILPQDTDNDPAAGPETVSPSSSESVADIVVCALDRMLESSQATVSVIEFLVLLEELRRQKKQDEARKQMEGLASEKLALELMLANEKQALTNEKQDLSDQLRTGLSQLHETQILLSREQALTSQLEQENKQLTAEKRDVLDSLQLRSEEISALKNELLKFQANYEKDKLLIESLTVRNREHEQVIGRLEEQIEEMGMERQSWDVDKEEYAHQVLVLTEERDAARTNEESLYAQLTESTLDLERLQESYVDMTDRYNEAQDEICDLREQIDTFKVSLADHFSVASKAAVGGAGGGLPGRPNSSATGSVSGSAAGTAVGKESKSTGAASGSMKQKLSSSSAGSNNSPQSKETSKSGKQSSSTSSSYSGGDDSGTGGTGGSVGAGAKGRPVELTITPPTNNVPFSNPNTYSGGFHEAASSVAPPKTPASMTSPAVDGGYDDDFDNYDDEFEEYN